MKTEFTPGTRVQWNIPGILTRTIRDLGEEGALAEIVRYLGEGFYAVRTIPEGRELVAAEYDIRREQP